MEISELLSQFERDVKENLGYFKDPDNYEAWLQRTIDRYEELIREAR